MFNIGSGEMIVIFLLALLVLGPERLPKAMGQVGKAVAQMRKLSGGFQDEIRRAMDPIEAPFRPGQETLRGPVPAVTDEVKVVSTDPGPVPEDEPPTVELAKSDEPPAVELADPPATDDPDDDADVVAVEPETQALVIDETGDAEPDEPAPRRGNVTPLHPRPDDAGDGGDRAAG